MLSNAEIELLTTERVARIATVNVKDKSPHLVPVCFAFDGKAFVTTLGVGSKRLRNVEQGSNVAILVDKYEEERGRWKVLRGILIYGNIKTLTFQENRDEFMYGWKLLIQKYPQYKQWAKPDFTPRDPEKRVIMKIEPTKTIRWSFE